MLTPTVSFWSILLPLALGLAAVYLLLPGARLFPILSREDALQQHPRLLQAVRVKPYPALWGAAVAALALLSAGWLLIWGRAAPVEAVLFYAFSGIAIMGGGLLITQRNPVRAALSFALVVLSTCGLFLLQAAPFLMAATIIVYAGAIVVTFLFVIMLAQQEGISDADQRSREPLLSTIAGFVLLGALLYLLNITYDTHGFDAMLRRLDAAADRNSMGEIEEVLGGEAFFTEFQRELNGLRASSDRETLEENLESVRLKDWQQWKKDNDLTAMREGLKKLFEEGSLVRDGNSVLYPHATTSASMSRFSQPPPNLAGSGETMAPLGLSLFTDYLVPVELGGTLLLVATIGAIAIAGRRPEGLR